MDGQLYIRIRGRVLGPYDREKLQSLANRGQFSRLHEVSTDGISWQRAAAFPELFVASVATESASAAQVNVAEPSNGNRYSVQPPPPPTSAAPRKQVWNYTSFGVEATAPVDFATLQSLAAGGRLSPSDQVWTDGMSEWRLASQVPGLMPVQGGRQSSNLESGGSESSADSISDEACRALSGSRPWVVFIAILCFLWSALTAVGAIFSFVAIQGNPVAATLLIVQGVFGLIFSFVVSIAGLMLMTYAGRIRDVMYHHKMHYLESSLHAVRVFWVYTGIVLIVLLALLVIFFVWLFAIAGGLAALGAAAR